MPGYKHACRYCEKYVPADSKVCPYCGKKNPTDVFRCPKCHTPTEKDYIACPSCGISLKIECRECKKTTFYGDYCFECGKPLPAYIAAPPGSFMCPKCHNPTKKEFVACPHCGISLQIECPQCKKKTYYGVNCQECGKPLPPFTPVK